MRRMLMMVLAAIAPIAVVLPSLPSQAATGRVDLPTAHQGSGRPTVGPLFAGGDATGRHSCTASVIDSADGDLILTAAHCVTGPAVGMAFAPGFVDGKTPYGVWKTTAAYVDPSWVSSFDPSDDFAVLRVAPQQRDGRTVNIQDVTGANRLGAPRPGAPIDITDVAYNSGVGGSASVCRTRMYWTRGYPAFTCAGFVGGSSGSPWITYTAQGVPEVVGVIGGLHQGGCLNFVSYSSDFSQDVTHLIYRAERHLPADDVPSAPSDGC